jgi:2-iminobutanoate/2-iminopropanoate deaminase
VSSKIMENSIRSYIQTDPNRPFSDAVLIDKTLYLSGCIGLEKGTSKVPASIEAEAHNMMENLQAVLIQADMTMDDLAYVQVFCTDVSLWERFNAIYRGFFGEKLPSRAFLGSNKLLFDAHFEIQGIAVKTTREKENILQ